MKEIVILRGTNPQSEKCGLVPAKRQTGSHYRTSPDPVRVLLAFDTLYAEGQRRYVESLSTYARQFLEQMEKPDVDHIEGLSPAISIEQKVQIEVRVQRSVLLQKSTII